MAEVVWIELSWEFHVVEMECMLWTRALNRGEDRHRVSTYRSLSSSPRLSKYLPKLVHDGPSVWK